MWIITHRRWFYGLSVLLLGSAILAISLWGLNPGIEFEGGSLIEVTYELPVPSVAEISSTLEPLSLNELSVRTTDDGFLIRSETLSEAERDEVTTMLVSVGEGGTIIRTDSVGPVLGKEAIQKSLVSIVLVLIAIVIFIAAAFRKVSKPVASWKYGVIAVIALFHDVLIPTGLFAYLGHFASVEVDTLFVTALLVVLGFSVHDTIVVFDRVRENLRLDTESKGKTPFDEIVGAGVSQTIVRSINTSFTTFLSLVALYFFGPETTKLFSLAMIVGVVVGTYSSIFIASPLLVTAYLFGKKKDLK